MPQVINETINEGGTVAITVTCKDETGSLFIPNSASWTLTDENGTTIINSRKDVSISSLDSTMTIALYGDDLAISGSSDEARLFTIEGTYDSTLGSNLPFKQDIKKVFLR